MVLVLQGGFFSLLLLKWVFFHCDLKMWKSFEYFFAVSLFLLRMLIPYSLQVQGEGSWSCRLCWWLMGLPTASQGPRRCHWVLSAVGLRVLTQGKNCIGFLGYTDTTCFQSAWLIGADTNSQSGHVDRSKLSPVLPKCFASTMIQTLSTG